MEVIIFSIFGMVLLLSLSIYMFVKMSKAKIEKNKKSYRNGGILCMGGVVLMGLALFLSYEQHHRHKRLRSSFDSSAPSAFHFY